MFWDRLTAPSLKIFFWPELDDLSPLSLSYRVLVMFRGCDQFLGWIITDLGPWSIHNILGTSEWEKQGPMGEKLEEHLQSSKFQVSISSTLWHSVIIAYVISHWRKREIIPLLKSLHLSCSKAKVLALADTDMAFSPWSVLVTTPLKLGASSLLPP